MTEPPDDLADLLDPQEVDCSPALRDLVLHRTERRLVRDRWARRGTRAAVLVGIFAAGGLLGWSARPERERAIELPGTVHFVFAPLPVPVLVSERSPTLSVASPVSATAAELEAEQQDDPNAAAKLYRHAGDAFLREQDYQNATRCYRHYIAHLARAGDEALTLDSSDSWLLMSLKNAAFKERFNVTKNDS